MSIATIRPGIGLLCRSRKLDPLCLKSLGRRWESTEPKVSFDDMLSRMRQDFPDKIRQRKDDNPSKGDSVIRPRRPARNSPVPPKQSVVSKIPTTEEGELQDSPYSEGAMSASPEILSGSLGVAAEIPSSGTHNEAQIPIRKFERDQGSGRKPRKEPRTAKKVQRDSAPKTGSSNGSTEITTKGPTGLSESKYYDNVFLRDCCTCSKCVDPSTRQKNFATSDIPPNIRPRTLVGGNEDVAIFWDNDIPGFDRTHVSHLNQHLLHKSISGYPPPPVYRRNKIPWAVDDLKSKMVDFDYNQYMSDDTTLLKLLLQLHVYGLAFIRNVPDQESSVSTTANRIGPLKNTFYGETWDVRSVSNAKNVAYTNVNLGFHMDLLYMMQPPRLQLLHCLRASTHGGISLFSDAYRAASDLCKQDKAALQDLADIGVNFHYDNDNHHYFQSRRTVQLDRDAFVSSNQTKLMSSLEAINWSPPFQAPFRAKSGSNFNKDMRKWHNAAQKFNSLVEAESAVYKRQMAPGECVIFDNRRVLHARSAFSGGERWLRGAYVDDDPFLSKTRVLWRQHGDQLSEQDRTHLYGDAPRRR